MAKFTGVRTQRGSTRITIIFGTRKKTFQFKKDDSIETQKEASQLRKEIYSDLADGSVSFHKIQETFKSNHGLQCGFCTPGILFSALELSTYKNIKSDDQIREFLDGNLCRCTGYHNIVKSIKSYLNKENLK